MTTESYTADLRVGYYNTDEEWEEFDGEVEFDVYVNRYTDFDGEWREMESNTVDIENVFITLDNRQIDIQPLMKKDNIENLKENCVDWVFANK